MIAFYVFVKRLLYFAETTKFFSKSIQYINPMEKKLQEKK